MIDTKHCRGCQDDYYNHTNCGLNMLDGKPVCWSRSDAKLVAARDIPIDLRPPYLSLPLIERPDCYKARGYVRVKESALDSKGYWRL